MGEVMGLALNDLKPESDSYEKSRLRVNRRRDRVRPSVLDLGLKYDTVSCTVRPNQSETFGKHIFFSNAQSDRRHRHLLAWSIC